LSSIVSTNNSGVGGILTALTASTAQKFLEFSSTGNTGFYVGIESSTGGAFFTGSNAYESVLYSQANNMYFRTPLARFSGNVAISGSSSGTTTLQATAAASGTLTLPAATDTLVGKATTDTLTNKNLVAPQFNGVTMSEAPVMTWSTFIPGNLTIITGVSQITIPKGITILRFESITYANAPSGCTTNAVLNIADMTNTSTLTTLTQSAQVSDSGPLSINAPAGHVLRVGVSTAASGCTTTPQNAVVEVQYRMQ
jgi:hypothetical protein